MANRTTKDFAEVISAKLASNPKLAEAVENEAFSADIAQKVYDLRKEAGLTQKQLASLIQTTQSVISRIEDADYDGHALTLLKRIAFALGKKLRVEFYGYAATNERQITQVFAADWKGGYSKWKPVFHQQVVSYAQAG